MPQGNIKKLVADKGFGFISGDKGDIFFHLSSVEGVRFEELTEGQPVEYETEISQKGPRAVSVRAL
ncbi:MAG: cold-shock DNA-binding protein family [Planctomycetaceae bacterium]|jgi:CspA family cold shock protein|nr:cold-shock DNA-binding protein family [Planctomycetaceae bacterium]